MRRLVFALVLCTAGASGARAGISLQTIDDTAQIYGGGSVISIGGPMHCDAGEVVTVTVSLTRDNAPLGTARHGAPCTGELGRWSAVVPAWGGDVAPGPAHAHAWAILYDADGVVKRWGWDKDVTLEVAE